MKREQIPVLFRVWRNESEVVAVFPTLPGTNARDTCTIYAHIGQHSSASDAYLPVYTRAAKPEEYAPLLRELTQIYDDATLRVVSRITHKMQRARYVALDASRVPV